MHFNIADPAILSRYRFGLSTADFLVCTRCGVYVAAVLTTRQGVFATLNVNTIRELQSALQRAEPAVYEGETPLERIARRERAWTPVTGGLPV